MTWLIVAVLRIVAVDVWKELVRRGGRWGPDLPVVASWGSTGGAFCTADDRSVRPCCRLRAYPSPIIRSLNSRID